MKNESTVDADARLDALLAGTPVDPSADFSRRAIEAIADDVAGTLLARKPAEPSADFADRVMSAIAAEGRGAVVAFPRGGKLLRWARSAAGVAAALALAVGLGLLSTREEATLSDRVAGVIAEDPELAQLVAADEDFSLDELFAASRLLTVLNETSAETAEFFAYYEN